MPANWMWKCTAVLTLLAGAGCCRWCERHCCPKMASCQPCVPCCPAPAAPVTTAAAPGCQPCVPCCPTPAVPASYPAYSAPGYAPAPAPGHTQQWQRNYTQGGCCE